MTETKMEISDEALKYKEQGNAAFKSENWAEALQNYTKAINSCNTDSMDLAVFYKNRAATYIKLNRYEDALYDCNKSLEITPSDPKALYRRCQALEALDRYEEAYRDATQIFKNDPNNKFIQPTLKKLHEIVGKRSQEMSQTENRLATMQEMAFNLNLEREKRLTAMNNLIVLAREKYSANLILQKSLLIGEIKKLLKVEKEGEISVASIRILGELCKHGADQAREIMKLAGIPWFLELIDSESEVRVNAAQHCIQVILNAFSGMELGKADTKPDKTKVDCNRKEIDTILTCLVFAVNNRAISGLARDAILELIMKNCHYTALNWAERLVEIGGVHRILEVASELQEFKYESSMNITKSSSTIASVCLAKLYENMYYDAAKANFLEKIQDFIKEKLLSPDIESKIRVIVTLTSLLRGPLDVGNTIVGKEGIMEMILVMANSEELLQQKVACECLIAAASKADKAKSIISQGINILKKLYKSPSDGVRVRALVGLCKLGSSGGTDSSLKPFAEGSNLKLAEACRRFLIAPATDNDLKKWAAEGLSYLTLDAEVKEKLVEDRAAISSLIELAKSRDQSCIFGVVTTLVNLVNAYEKQEVLPEMVELAKFAKQHVPEEHELDDPDFVTKRIIVLGNVGVASALVALSKTDSDSSRELIGRVFNALCSEAELRGAVVQQGGVKALIGLSQTGTERGKRQAAQALARIGITIDPEVAFPGQRALEVVRPLIALLHPDCTGLENFEALMALCNIAQINEVARQRILKEGGLSKIEHYMFEDHQYICRAATQCLCNMTMSPDVIKVYEGQNDKLKYLVSLAMDEDIDTGMAAAGALAILTGESEQCCQRVFDSKNWLDSLHLLLANPVPSMQYRGVCLVKNLVEKSKELTEKLMETDIMEILMALTKLPLGDAQKIISVAMETLEAAEKWGVIQRPPTSSTATEENN